MGAPQTRSSKWRVQKDVEMNEASALRGAHRELGASTPQSRRKFAMFGGLGSRWVLLLVVVVLAVLLTACGGDGGSAGASDEGADAAAEAQKGGNGEAGDDETERALAARVSIAVDGAVSFAWEGVEEVQVTRVGAPGLSVNLLSVGFLLPKKLDDPQNRFRWALDLVDTYEGPGSYQIDPAPDAQGFKDLAFLIYMRVFDGEADTVYSMDEVETYQEFREIRQPCALEVGEGARAGTLSCPELATEDGEAVRMTVSWESA